jgi:class 3 adenylate cyclase/tetratricopeptide (TPR) repeat protein
MAHVTRRLAAVAFADVAGWSRLVEENDLEALRDWNTLRTGLIEPKILEHGGRLVDLAGDAVLVEFPSAVAAVNWAVDLQRRPVDVDAEGAALPLSLRIGINVGDILVDEGRLIGDGVNIAARIHQAASPGEIIVTDAVREHVHRRIAAAFHDLGERQLKNISHPVRVFRVETHHPAAPGSSLTPGTAPARTLLALDLPPSDRVPSHDEGQTNSSLHSLQEYFAHRVLPENGGCIVGRDDNGLLIDFATARPAVRAALAIQQACSDAVAGLSLQHPSLPRIGVQIDPLPGDSANSAPGGLATRLTAIAQPGEIVASSAVCAQLTSTLDADIEDLGEHHLVGMDQPVHAYRLGPPALHAAGEPDSAADELRPTIAVIPFTEHGAGHEPLGEILAEEVISSLSRSAELNVVSRLSTTAFRARGATLNEIRSHLRATYVLSGAYRVSMDALILAVELADARSGRVVWAKDLKGSVAGIIEGKDELIDRVVAEANHAIGSRELERARSQSLQSLDTCTLLVGAIVLMHRLSKQEFKRARDMLLVVTQRAPRHPIPLAWLAKWHVLHVWQNWSDNVAADTRCALDFGKRALDNDSQCSLALAIDGFAHTNLLKRLDVAQERYDLALQVNPNDSMAWLLSGMLHAFKGEGKLAVKSSQRALRLSPLDPHRYFYDALAGGAELAAGRYERAIELTQRSLRANRMHSSTFRMLAISQWQLGRHDEARATVAELMKVEPNLRVSQWLERSPSGAYPIGRLCAEALRGAGVPD